MFDTSTGRWYFSGMITSEVLDAALEDLDLVAAAAVRRGRTDVRDQLARVADDIVFGLPVEDALKLVAEVKAALTEVE